MIFDSIKHCEAYKSLSPAFKAAFEFLEDEKTASLPVGRYDIDSSRVYAMVQAPALKDWDAGKWEAHRRYADIQYIMEGEETMGFACIDTLKETEAYSSEKDVLFCEGEGSRAVARPGDFMVFFPQDAHKPCIRSTVDTDKKIVVKVLLDD